MLNKFSKINVVIAFVINIFLAGMDRGFSFQFYQFRLSEPQIAGSNYFYIIFFLIIYLLGEFIKRKIISFLVGVSALALIINQYKYIYWYAIDLSDEKEPFSLLFRETNPLNWISFSLVMILLIFQIVSILHHCFYKNQKIT